MRHVPVELVSPFVPLDRVQGVSAQVVTAGQVGGLALLEVVGNPDRQVGETVDYWKIKIGNIKNVVFVRSAVPVVYVVVISCSSLVSHCARVRASVCVYCHCVGTYHAWLRCAPRKRKCCCCCFVRPTISSFAIAKRPPFPRAALNKTLGSYSSYPLCS